MTLPASGPISLSQVSVELGRAANYPTSLGESAVWALYNSTNTTEGPYGPTVSLSGLWGKTAAAPVNFPNGTVIATTNNFNAQGSVNIVATAYIYTDGSFGFAGSAVRVTSNTGSLFWYNPVTTGIGSSYWVNVTVSGAAVTGSPLGWQQLTAALHWTLTRNLVRTSGGFDVTSTLSFTIAKTNGGAAVATGSITLEVVGTGAVAS